MVNNRETFIITKIIGVQLTGAKIYIYYYIRAQSFSLMIIAKLHTLNFSRLSKMMLMPKKKLNTKLKKKSLYQNKNIAFFFGK